MTMKEISKMSRATQDAYLTAMAERGNMRACAAIRDVQKFYNKRVTVVKGRKVPHGTTGLCFWMGECDYSKYGDPWGIYSSIRIGIKTDDGAVHWTALDNVQLAEEGDLDE